MTTKWKTSAALACVALFTAVGARAAAPVANPGPFTANFTSGSIQLGHLGVGITSATAIAFSGSVDADGNIHVASAGASAPAIPFSTTATLNGVTAPVIGSLTLVSAADAVGHLNPSTGEANLALSVYASITLTVGDNFGTGFTGTCSVGTAASPIGLVLSTAPPGSVYSQTTGNLTLSAAMTVPGLSNCIPSDPGVLSIVSNLLISGNGRITLTGQLSPVITAGAAGSADAASASQAVTATVGSVLSVTVPSSITFPTLLPGETSAPVSSPVTVSSSDPAGYQLSVTRTAFTGGDLPLSIGSATTPDSGMLLDLVPLAATPIPTSGGQNIGHRSGTPSLAAGDVWPTALVLGPIPNTTPGTHTATVIYTAVGF
jgi:hypothetical protein